MQISRNSLNGFGYQIERTRPRVTNNETVVQVDPDKWLVSQRPEERPVVSALQNALNTYQNIYPRRIWYSAQDPVYTFIHNVATDLAKKT